MVADDEFNLEFLSLEASERQAAFELYREHFYAFVEQAIGWDEGFQRRGFMNNYQTEWLHWVSAGEDTVALLCHREYPRSMHVHLLLVMAQGQRSGWGRRTVLALQRRAAERELPISLSCFKCNRRALAFYDAMDFAIVAEDEHFYSLRWSPVPG